MVAQLFAPRLLVVGGPMTTIWSFYDRRLSGRALKPAVIGKKISPFTLTTGGDKQLTRALALARA